MGVLQRSIAAWCAATALCALAADRRATPDPSVQLAGSALVEALRAGGLTLYFRHAATDHSQRDGKDAAFEDCASQRNLNEQGRNDARAIGEALRELGLPLGEVLASPYCRTMETARLLAGRASPSREVLGMMASRAGRIDFSALDALLATPPEPGTLRLIVGHGNSLQTLAGDPELAEGEVAVVRGDGKDWRVVARFPARAWAGLTRSAPPPAAGSAPRRSDPN